MKKVLLLVIAFFITNCCSAEIINVPGNYLTIQEAVDAAFPGDTVMVESGIYSPVEASYKDGITLLGSGMIGPTKTTINGSGNHCITVNYSSGWVIKGFELHNAFQGVRLHYSDECEVTETYAHDNYLNYSVGVSIEGCSDIYYHHNVVELNDYSGIWSLNSQHLRFINNTVVNNGGNGILICTYDPELEIVNNIVAYNEDDGIESVPDQTSAIANYNDVFGNGDDPWVNITPQIGNISEDPEFVNGPPFTYALFQWSPCIDTGDPAILDPDSTRSDIGACYYDQSNLPQLQFSEDSLFFPDTYVGSEEILALTITNSGENDLIIWEMNFGMPGVFSTTWDPNDSLLVPGEDLVIDVVFAPQAFGIYIDFMEIVCNGIDKSVYLYGTTFSPEIELSADSLEFADTAVGETDSLELKIYNEGTDDLVIFDITNTQTEVFNTDWNQIDSVIVPGDSLELMVYFSPPESELYTDWLVIENNDQEAEVYLYGMEANVSVSITLSPHVLNIQIPPGGGSFNYDAEKTSGLR